MNAKLRYDAHLGIIKEDGRQVAALSPADRDVYGPMFAAAPVMLETLRRVDRRRIRGMLGVEIRTLIDHLEGK